MKKNRIRLTEADLHRIIKESVNRVLMEMEEPGQKAYPIQKYNEMKRHFPYGSVFDEHELIRKGEKVSGLDFDGIDERFGDPIYVFKKGGECFKITAAPKYNELGKVVVKGVTVY